MSQGTHPPGEVLAPAVELLRGARHAVALTGAGVSVASGIPDFRSAGGLWERYDPDVYATLSGFLEDPAAVWGFYHDLHDLVAGAAPNPGHHALARLERAGRLSAVVTQNVDGLHEAAGSTVVPIHGQGGATRCISCGFRGRWPARDQGVPHCPVCHHALKTDVILFEEPLNPAILEQAVRWVERSDLLIVAGTSALVYPAAELPSLARVRGIPVLEINLETTPLSPHALSLVGRSEELLPLLVDAALGAEER